MSGGCPAVSSGRRTRQESDVGRRLSGVVRWAVGGRRAAGVERVRRAAGSGQRVSSERRRVSSLVAPNPNLQQQRALYGIGNTTGDRTFERQTFERLNDGRHQHALELTQ